jgi:hypothetical protein
VSTQDVEEVADMLEDVNGSKEEKKPTEFAEEN